MLKEVLYVEEADKPTSPVVGLQRPAQSHDLIPLPSSLGSFEFNLPSHLEEHLSEVQERTPPYVELPAAKRQATLPVVLEMAPSTESPLQSPFASAENIDRFLEDVPEQERAPQQLQHQLQQNRQHSAPAPLTLSRALLESQSQELSLQQICSSDEAKARVASLPTSKMLACSNMQVSLSPVVWRDFELPHRVMVNLGLRCVEMGGDSCYPASMYSAFNPRVITTGTLCTASWLYSGTHVALFCKQSGNLMGAAVCIRHSVLSSESYRSQGLEFLGNVFTCSQSKKSSGFGLASLLLPCMWSFHAGQCASFQIGMMFSVLRCACQAPASLPTRGDANANGI